MSEKPTQAEYCTMLAMLDQEINGLYRDRSAACQLGEPTDLLNLLIGRWEEIRKCVEACQRVDRLTRVEHVKGENAECAVCRDANAEVFPCTDGLPRCRRCGGGA